MKKLNNIAIIISFLGVLSCSKEETNQTKIEDKIDPKVALLNILLLPIRMISTIIKSQKRYISFLAQLVIAS